jgi:hypothetical protein
MWVCAGQACCLLIYDNPQLTCGNRSRCTDGEGCDALLRGDIIVRSAATDHRRAVIFAADTFAGTLHR